MRINVILGSLFTGKSRILSRLLPAVTSPVMSKTIRSFSNAGTSQTFDIDMIRGVYERYLPRLQVARRVITRPLTFAEKILFTHIHTSQEIGDFERGRDYIPLAPDRVAMQDASAQMAILQFISAGKSRSEIPVSVHCDHLIQGDKGAKADLASALKDNKEVYDFLSSASSKYGFDCWLPGSGIIHQLFLEKYAFPGGFMLGTDSHSPTASGLGMIGIGVGGADAVDAMVGIPWELKSPKIIGIKLTGKLSGWVSPKDVILYLLGKLSVKGGTGCILEYFGEGAETISATGKATMTNMGAETGATSSTLPYDKKISDYLRATNRGDIAEMADSLAHELQADPEVLASPEKYYDQVIEIDLSQIEPHISGPSSPDKAWPLSKFAEVVQEQGWPQEISSALVGSCTNSSYEDLSRSASIIRQALAQGLRAESEFLLAPGSEFVRFAAEKTGLLDVFEKFGAQILANACGPCVGKWKRAFYETNPKDTPNSIISTFNRNFDKRNDGNPMTRAFLASPEIVTAMAIAGSLSFNPLTDPLLLMDDNSQQVMLQPPKGDELPPAGTFSPAEGYQPPAKNPAEVQVIVDPESQRLQLLEPFPEWKGVDFEGMRVVIKVKGKCTTDHISPNRGEWLKYKGHLGNIAENTLIDAENAFNGGTNKVRNEVTGQHETVPDSMKKYQQAGIDTLIIADENYGEGSAREHAAMQPRYLGVKAVIARSYARIHETNLKKQGVLALTFSDKADYDKIREDDVCAIRGLTEFQPAKPLILVVTHSDGTEDSFELQHTYNETQIEWFKAGSALNAANKKGGN